VDCLGLLTGGGGFVGSQAALEWAYTLFISSGGGASKVVGFGRILKIKA